MLGDLQLRCPACGALHQLTGDLLLLGPRDALAVRVSLSRMPATRLPTFASLVRASGSILLDLRGELRAWSGRVCGERTPEGHIGTERVRGPCPRCRSRSASRTPLATSACGTGVVRSPGRPTTRRRSTSRTRPTAVRRVTVEACNSTPLARPADAGYLASHSRRPCRAGPRAGSCSRQVVAKLDPIARAQRLRRHPPIQPSFATSSASGRDVEGVHPEVIGCAPDDRHRVIRIGGGLGHRQCELGALQGFL